MPTRELAAQAAREFDLIARHTQTPRATVVGGESERHQIDAIRKGAQVLVACPGRLIDFIERGIVKLDKVEVVIIDEADRLLDMGFLPQLRRIMKMVPKQRQTHDVLGDDGVRSRDDRARISDDARARHGRRDQGRAAVADSAVDLSGHAREQGPGAARDS